MKRIILSLCLTASLNTVFSQEIVYLVSYDSSGVIVAKKCLQIDEVEKLMNDKFQQFKTDKLFFDFYIEKKRLNKTGKMKSIKK